MVMESKFRYKGWFFVLLVLSLSLLAKGAEASIGVAVSPAAETITVDIRGDAFSFTVFNTGNESGNYTVNLEGEGKDFIPFNETVLQIKGGAYETLRLSVEPNENVSTNRTYDLNITVYLRPSSNESFGFGLATVAKLKLQFVEDKSKLHALTPPPQQENKSGEQKTQSESAAQKVATATTIKTLLSYLFVILLAALIIAIPLAFPPKRKTKKGK